MVKQMGTIEQEEKQMATNVNDEIRKLSLARRKKVEARAAQLIAEERKLITAYERGEFRPLKDQKGAKQIAVVAARRYKRLTGSLPADK